MPHLLMASIVFLAAVLSLDVTRVLVENGYGLGYDTDAAAAASDGVGRFTATLSSSTGLAFPPLNIVDCTGNGVGPIVVTTEYPHGVSDRGIGGMSCIVDGVLGNTAANNVATQPRDFTVGLNQGVLAVPLSPTTLALYGQDQDPTSATVGQIAPLVGNGTYTSGGTITPALTDGSILIGRAQVREHSAPPRIVLIPTSISWSQRTGSVPNGNRTGEIKRQRQQRSVATIGHTFAVHVWGQRNPNPSDAYDFDVCLEIAASLNLSAHLLFGQQHTPIGGSWDDQKERDLQYVKAGHLLTFSLDVALPDLDYRLPFVPDGTVFTTTAQSPTPEIAQTFDTPLG